MDDDTLFNVQLCKSLKHKNGLCLVIDTEEEILRSTKCQPRVNTKQGGKRTRLAYMKGKFQVNGLEGYLSINLTCWQEKMRKGATGTDEAMCKGANTRALYLDDRYLVIEIENVYRPITSPDSATAGSAFYKDPAESLLNMTVISSTTGSLLRKGMLPIKFKLHITSTALKALRKVESWRRAIVRTVESWKIPHNADKIFPSQMVDSNAMKSSLLEDTVILNKLTSQERASQLEQKFIYPDPNSDGIVIREETDEEEYSDDYNSN